MESVKSQSNKTFVLGIAKRAYVGDKQEIKDFNSDQLSMINLGGLPMCRMHDVGINPGVWKASFPIDDMMFVFGQVDGDDSVSKFFVDELKSGYLSELSLSHATWAYKDGEDNNKMNILKLPLEISAVDKGLEERCHILGVYSEDDLRAMDSKTITPPQQAPAPVAKPSDPTQQTPPTAQTQASTQPPAQPQNLDLKNIDSNSLLSQDHAALAKLAAGALKKVDELSGELAKASEYKVAMEKNQAEQNEEIRSKVYNILKEGKGAEHAEKMKQTLEGVFQNKSLDQLQKDGRMFHEVVACAENWRNRNVALEQEIQLLKTSGFQQQMQQHEDLASTLLRQVNNVGPQQRRESTSQRFNPYDIARAEKVQEPPKAIDPESQKKPATSASYALPKPGTEIYQRAMSDPATYHQLQLDTQNAANPDLMERLTGMLKNPMVFGNRMQH